MATTCETVQTQVLVPGTGVFVPSAGENWDASAITQLGPVDPYGNWRYAFDPVQGSAFVTGIFDQNEYSEPRPNRYVIAVEFEVDKYRVRLNNEESAWIAWTDERLALQSENGQFKLFADGTEVWAS